MRGNEGGSMISHRAGSEGGIVRYYRRGSVGGNEGGSMISYRAGSEGWRVRSCLRSSGRCCVGCSEKSSIGWYVRCRL